MEYHDNAQKEAAPGSPELSSPPLVSGRLPPEQVLGPLARTLEQIQHNYSPSSLQNSYVDTETGVVDWALADYDTDLAEPLQAHLLAQDLAEYLRNGDIDHNSDDDSEERSQFSKSSESDNGKHILLYYGVIGDIVVDSQVPVRRSRKVDSDAVDSPWFPWPDKEVLVTLLTSILLS